METSKDDKVKIMETSKDDINYASYLVRGKVLVENYRGYNIFAYEGKVWAERISGLGIRMTLYSHANTVRAVKCAISRFLKN